MVGDNIDGNNDERRHGVGVQRNRQLSRFGFVQN